LRLLRLDRLLRLRDELRLLLREEQIFTS